MKFKLKNEYLLIVVAAVVIWYFFIRKKEEPETVVENEDLDYYEENYQEQPHESDRIYYEENRPFTDYEVIEEPVIGRPPVVVISPSHDTGRVETACQGKVGFVGLRQCPEGYKPAPDDSGCCPDYNAHKKITRMVDNRVTTIDGFGNLKLLID